MACCEENTMFDLMDWGKKTTQTNKQIKVIWWCGHIHNQSTQKDSWMKKRL
jgi:hypothetical protein